MTSPYKCEYAVEVLRRAVKVNEFDDEIEVPGTPETVTVFGWYVGGRVEGRPDGHVYQVEWDIFMPVTVFAFLGSASSPWLVNRPIGITTPGSAPAS